MKNRFATIFSLLCALILAVCAVSACADETAATATDLPEEEAVQPAETEEEAAPATEEENSQEVTEAPQEKKEPEAEQSEADIPEENLREEMPEAGEEKTAQPEEEVLQAESEKGTEESRTSAEMIISKAVRIGSIWEGLTKDTTPAILKLDVDQAQTVHLIVEGKKVIWATVEKSDRPETNPQKVLSDPETKRVMISLEAEKGSYLIKIGPEEPNRNAKVIVTILDDEGFEAWLLALEEETEAGKTESPEQAEEQIEPEQQGDEKPAETEPENEVPGEGAEAEQETEPETENPAEPDPEGEHETEETENEPESVLPANRSIDVALTWDTENPQIGDTAHLKATLNGYDELSYTLQWQYSADDRNWTDAAGETNDNIDITISEENNYLYWRILVYIEQPAEK